MGEYARSLCIAEALKDEFNQYAVQGDIVFGLNRNAPYFSSCPFRTYELSQSPTLCSAEVFAAIDAIKPQLVFFDASGRAAQLAYCRKKGIKTVYVAQHDKKLKRALGIRRLRNTDKLFVAQYEALGRALSGWQRLKLKYMHAPFPHFVGPVFREQTREQQYQSLKEYGLESQAYIFLNAGGGGNYLDKSRALLAVDFLEKFARELENHTRLPIVLVAGKNYPGTISVPSESKRIVIHSCSGEVFNTLLRHAHLNILSGGSALLQALACGQRNIVAMAVASDQKTRIDACVTHYGIRYAANTLEELLTATLDVLANPRDDLSVRTKAEPIVENTALHVVVAELLAMLGINVSRGKA